MAALTNDELIKLRSRLYRGYRAPLATTDFFNDRQIVSMTRDGSGNVTQTVYNMTMGDGTTVTETTDYTIDPSTGNVESSTVTYSYDRA